MNIIGLSPSRIFSGFETSFFEAINKRGASVTRVAVEVPWFKLFSIVRSFHPVKKKWGTRNDVSYHASMMAFKIKSRHAYKIVRRMQEDFEVIYQIGGLWNPVGDGIKIPLVIQVDYTSLLSKKRGSEWKRKEGKEETFWIGQEKKLYNDARFVLTTTENARRSIIEDYGISPRKVITVGGGVSPPYSNLEPDRKPKYDSRRILFIGKGYHGKGLDTLLDAFRNVHREIPDARLTIVGPTQASFDQEGIDYLGRIADRNRVRELYFDHAIFVMPSRFEPLGQTFLEAMSCHLPCIGTTADAMPELIDHGRTGFVVEPGDDRALANHLKDLLSNPQKAAEMGERGFEKVSTTFTWPAVSDKIIHWLREAVG